MIMDSEARDGPGMHRLRTATPWVPHCFSSLRPTSKG